MAIQPDMIVQFAHEVARRYADLLGVASETLEVRAQAYVSLNGRSSRLLVEPTVDLMTAPNDLWPKDWLCH